VVGVTIEGLQQLLKRSDGNNLSGLKKLTVVTIAMSGGNNPFQAFAAACAD